MEVQRAKWLYERREYFKLLNIDPRLRGDSLLKACRRARAAHHPDRGGNPDVAAMINAAADTLSKPRPLPESCLWDSVVANRREASLRRVQEDLRAARLSVHTSLSREEGVRDSAATLNSVLTRARDILSSVAHACEADLKVEILLAEAVFERVQARQRQEDDVRTKKEEQRAVESLGQQREPEGSKEEPRPAKRMPPRASKRCAQALWKQLRRPCSRSRRLVVPKDLQEFCPVLSRSAREVRAGLSAAKKAMLHDTLLEARMQLASIGGLPRMTAWLRKRMPPETQAELEDLRRQCELTRTALRQRRRRGRPVEDLERRLEELALQGWRLFVAQSNKEP